MADIWITGASGAIGRACAAELNGHPHRLMLQHIDMATNVRYIKSKLGKYEPEVLVYSAGVNLLNWSMDINTEWMLECYEVNVVGLVRCLQAAPTIKKVVAIGSDAAHMPMRTSIAYNASKAALEAAVKVIARERAAEGFVINVVAPGLIAGSDMTEYVLQRTKELRPDFDWPSYALSGIPSNRVGSPGEVARVVKWLVDEAPDYINGSVLTINGGRG